MTLIIVLILQKVHLFDQLNDVINLLYHLNEKQTNSHPQMFDKDKSTAII